jgi:hypothetical protein
MKDLSGQVLPSIESSTKIWHMARSLIGKDHTNSSLFDTSYLAALNQTVATLLLEGDPPLSFSDTLHRMNVEPITLPQVMTALKSCPNGSSAGLDRVHYEAFKYGSKDLCQCLTDILQISWNTELHPTQWDNALVAPLFKGGPEHNDVTKYRAITLLSTSCKLYEAVLLNKILTVLVANGSLSDTQAGFVTDVSSHEPAAGVLATLEHRANKGLRSYVAFIDFRTAFPSTFKPLVWTRLAEAGVRGHLWRVTKQLYTHARSRVAHPEIPPGEFFHIPQGLREGSKLSPLLFNLAVNDMEAELLKHSGSLGHFGIPRYSKVHHSTQHPNNVRTSVWQYADDVALITSSESDLKRLLEKMAVYCYQRGLTINYDKSHYMVISKDPFVEGTTIAFSNPNNPMIPLSISQVESFKYLGIPIHRDLSTAHIAKAACTKAWAAHHAAQRAGMRHFGLPLSSRFVAWKAFVLPHILFYLPFVSHKDIPEIQTMVNSSLRDITDERASPEALLAEIGLLPVKWLWAQSMAKTGGRLQTNKRPLRAAELVSNLLHHPPFNDNKGWGLEYKIALAWLDLRSHWPYLIPETLPKPQDPNDLYLLENPGMTASPLAPFRQSWNQVVKRQARILAESEHSKWLGKTDHRACSFKTETLSGLSDIPKVYVKASWLELHLPTPIAQRLLRRRVLATDLDTHTPSSRKNGEDYEESYCALCARREGCGKSEENQETMAHFLWECIHLGPEQTVLEETLTRFVLDNGGIPSANLGPTLQWKDMSDTDKLGLLMGNHIPAINHISNEYTIIQNWRTAFLEAADSPLNTLWKKRAQLIVETFPEWSISSSDPTSIIRRLHED